jgi:hypothetical protein
LGGLGPRERIVPLNSWPMVMGRDSFVTGWGVTGEKLERVGQWYASMACLEQRIEWKSVLGASEVLVEVYKALSVTWQDFEHDQSNTYLFHRYLQMQA